ncbi:MAG: zinc-ribbon domain-containing protein [Oscillospiraceae bacterium]|nr:zinc-ribbon domain-containing protein [Oscillospiraceae bacterium]
MFCGNCGKQLADNAKFCGGCGKSLVPGVPANPAAQVNVPNQQVNMPKPTNGQPYQGQPYRGQQYPGQQPYGQGAVAPKNKKKLVITLVSLALVAVIAGVLLWVFVFSNPLAGTCWVSEDGAIITFTDDENGYYEDDGGKLKFTYTVKDDRLSISPKDEEEITYIFREEGDWLVLTIADADVEMAWCNAEKAFFCAYCENAYYRNKHTGTMDGTEYDFCENCWDEVQGFLN